MTGPGGFALLVLALAVALPAGCGGVDGEAEGVERVVEEVFTSNDPSVCRLLSAELLERTAGERGEDALAECVEQVQQGDPPESVSVEDITVEGDRATASFATAGGELEGGSGEVGLVLDGDQWKVDAVSFHGVEAGQPGEGD